MHITNVREVVFELAIHANGILPRVNKFQDLCHWRRRERRGLFGKSANEFVEEVLGRDLEMEGIATVLHEDVEQLKPGPSEERN